MVTEIGGVWAAATHVRPDVMRQARAQSVTALSFSAQFALRHPTLRPHLVPPTLSFTPSYKPFPPSCTQWSMYRRSPPSADPPGLSPLPQYNGLPGEGQHREAGARTMVLRLERRVVGCRVPGTIDQLVGTGYRSRVGCRHQPCVISLRYKWSAARGSSSLALRRLLFWNLARPVLPVQRLGLWWKQAVGFFFSPLILRQSIVQYPAVPTRRSKQWNSKSFVYLLFPLVTCTLSRSMEV